MPVKVIMSWDIAPEKEQEYFEFVVRDFIPGLQKLGFELSDAWATVYGSQPQIMVGATVANKAKADEILVSTDWRTLNDQLQEFVRNYMIKVVEARSGFQF